jgi:hypothetical protein
LNLHRKHETPGTYLLGTRRDIGDAPTFLAIALAPTRSGYRAYEPPLKSGDRRCTGATARPPEIDAPDPARDRNWRLDEARTATMVRLLAADPRVRRVFIEPHLKTRLGLGRLSKVRFAGCRAARHDDHIHVDFH